MSLTDTQAHNLGTCPDQKFNQLPFGAWVDAQPLSHTGQASFLVFAFFFYVEIIFVFVEMEEQKT